MPRVLMRPKILKGDAKSKPLTSMSKAAVLMIALGPDSAAKILKSLPDSEVEKLSIELARIGSIASEAMSGVIQEFYEMMMARSYVSQGGLDFAREILEKAWGAGKTEDIFKRLEAATDVSAFTHLGTVDDSQISSFLQDEHPQTAALILAHLKPKQAATIISSLTPELQAEISFRLVTMEKTSPELVREIESVLHEQIDTVFGGDLSTVGGATAVADIINNAPRATERNILEGLKERDPDLATEVSDLLFSFDDVVGLDNTSLQEVVKGVEGKVLALALKGASEELKEKIFGNMSTRASGMMKDEIRDMGAVRVREVEEAQSVMLDLIRRLDEAGTITIARGDEQEEVIE